MSSGTVPAGQSSMKSRDSRGDGRPSLGMCSGDVIGSARARSSVNHCGSGLQSGSGSRLKMSPPKGVLSM